MRRRRDLLLGAASLLAGLGVVYRGALAGKVLAGRDIFRLFLPQAAFLEDCLARRELPLWIPNVWLGQPFAATIQSQAFYPVRLLLLPFTGAIWICTIQQLAHVVIAVLGTWVLCRSLGASQRSSAIAGLAFGLGPMFSSLSNTPNLIASLAWTGWILAAVRVHSRRPSLRTTSWIAAAAALSFLGGSPETLLWQAGLAVGCSIAWSPRRLSAPSLVVAGLAWAILAAGFVFFPAVELASLSTRVDAADQLFWSVSVVQLLSAVLPAADMPKGDYWGADQWLLGSQFIGTLICLSALASKWRSRRAAPFAVGGLLLLALSMGSHLWPAAQLLKLPPLSLFRYPAKYFLGGAFCLCVLAGLGIDRLAARARLGRSRPLGVVAVLAALFGVLGALTLAPDFLPLRSGARVGPVWVALVCALAGAAFFGLPSGLGRGKRFRAAAVIVIGTELTLAHLGLWPLAWNDPERLARPSSLAQSIPRPFLGRVSFGAAEPNDVVVARDPSKPGSDPARLLIDSSRDRLVPLRFIEEGLLGFEGYEPPVPRRAAALRELQTRGVFDLVGVSLYTRPAAPDFPDLEEVARGPDRTPILYRSTTAMPRAFVVHRAVQADDVAVVRALEDPSQPARHTAFLADGDPLDAADCEGSMAVLRASGNQQLTITATACDDGYLVVSDAFFPGWEATVNGVPTPIHRSDLALRAVKIPKGTSVVEMRYRPASFGIGVGVAMPALGLLAFAQRRRKKSGV